MASQPPVHTFHVVGRVPGRSGRGETVAGIDGVEGPAGYGTHHEAAYVGAIVGLFEAWSAGHAVVAVTSTSEHLVEQMTGAWTVGPELAPFHRVAAVLAARFRHVSWTKV